MKTKQSGFAAIEVLLVVAVLGVLGYVGWKVYENNKPLTSDETNTAVDNSPAVEKANDLDEATDYLNSQNIDEKLDTAEIDAALSE